MTQDPENGFIGAIPEDQADLVGGTGHTVGQDRFHTALQVENRRRCFFACLNAGLVVGIDVDEFALQANSALEQRNQGTKAPGIKTPHADRHALAPTLSEG